MQMSNASDDYVTFGAPAIAPRVYIVKGPSGWNETFQRTACDEELRRFLAPLAVEEAVSLFVAQRTLSDDAKPTEWFTIVGFIGRTMGVSPRAVPHKAAIAFWAKVITEMRSQGAN